MYYFYNGGLAWYIEPNLPDFDDRLSRYSIEAMKNLCSVVISFHPDGVFDLQGNDLPIIVEKGWSIIRRNRHETQLSGMREAYSLFREHRILLPRLYQSQDISSNESVLLVLRELSSSRFRMLTERLHEQRIVNGALFNDAMI